jgi:DNA-binding response OmpR family regulator
MDTVRLLVVDDAFTILSLVENLFKKKFEVIKCRSVKEAMEVMEYVTPDIVVTDLNMPEISGEDFVVHMKSENKFEHIPIIVLSSSDNTNTRLRLLRMGIDDFVQKPFNPEELGLRMENILRRYNPKVLVS